MPCHETVFKSALAGALSATIPLGKPEMLRDTSEVRDCAAEALFSGPAKHLEAADDRCF